MLDPWSIHHGDCLQVLPTLADNSVDLIVTDPPYFRVKDEPWDNAWETPEKFLAWLDLVLAEFARVLKPNGSLYLFASPQMSARVECLIAGRFAVLTRATWRKDAGWGKKTRKEDLRTFFPASESIVIAEHYGFVFEPLRAYFAEARDKSGLSVEQIRDGMHRLTGKRYVFEKHSFCRAQWELPTREQYAAAQTLFGASSLHRSYESLYTQYESLRRPFAVSADVPYTDVWDFATVPHKPGKHPCEKPLDLCRHMIAASSRPGAVVLDAFCGSGAVGEAAVGLGRRFIGIDADARWCERTKSRLAQRGAGGEQLQLSAP